jgi:hypothetical protein
LNPTIFVFVLFAVVGLAALKVLAPGIMAVLRLPKPLLIVLLIVAFTLAAYITART